MAEEIIGLLFGVEGVGVNGASGQEIVKGLTKIVNEINSGKSTVPKIKFQFDTSGATKAVNDLKTKLENIENIASIKISHSNGGQGGSGGSISKELQAEMKKLVALQKQISSTRIKISNLGFDSGDVDLISAYTGELERLEDQYDKTMHTFMKKLTGNYTKITMGDIGDWDAHLTSLQRIEQATVSANRAKQEATSSDKRQLKVARELKSEMADLLALQKKISEIKVSIGKLELEGGNANQITEYISQLERLEDQYAQMMQSFMKKAIGNAGDVAFDDIKSFQEQYANLEQIANDTLALAQAKDADAKASELQKQKYDELSATIKEWVRLSKQGARLAAEYSSITRNSDGSIAGSVEGYEETIRAINDVISAMKELSIAFDDNDNPSSPNEENFANIAAEIGVTEEQCRSLFAQIQSGSVTVGTSIQNANRKNQQSWTATASKIRDEVQRMYDTIAKDPNAKKMADEIIKYSQSAEGSVGDLKNKYDELRNVIHESGADVETWGDKFKKTFAGKVRSALAATITGTITKYLREIYTSVVEIDKAVVDLQIATGKSRSEVQGLIKDYAQLAKQLGATVTDITESANTWLRQGYSAEEANTLIANSTMLAKLGQMESAEAATALTSAMKGYNVTVEDSIGIIDKFTAVDMDAAASAGDIATAMSETATSARIAGVSMDRLIGYIATVKEVTQDGAESVGKRIAQQYSNVLKVGNNIGQRPEVAETEVTLYFHKNITPHCCGVF